MGWKTINGRRYFYKSERLGGRARTTYYAGRESDRLISLMGAEDRGIREAGRKQRKIDEAHARFLSPPRTLARVRKLAVPALQLNLARNQVNVAEAGS
jgi:hypothetical protein